MKILLTVDPEIPVPPGLYGGIERIVEGLVTELRTRGHTIGLIAHPESTCQVDNFFPWPGRSSRNRVDSIKNTMWLFHKVVTFDPDIVHSFSRLGYLLPLLCTRKPVLMSYQRHTGGKRIGRMARLFKNRLQFTACSEFIANLGRPWGGEWHVIPNFVDCGLFQFQNHVGPDAPLLFLSRIEEIKGVHLAIEIAKGACRKLIIAGNRVKDPKGESYWRDSIAPHIDKRRIRYHGPVDDLQKNRLLGLAAALLVPVQWDEPFGIVFAEALACGTPVISCPRGALPEIISHGSHGFLVNSVDSGVAAVREIGTISRAACRKRAEEEFSVGVIAARYQKLYERIVSENR